MAKSKKSKRIKPNAGAPLVAPGATEVVPAQDVPESVPMQPAPNQPDWSKMHIHFGIPCYGGQITEPTFTSF